MCIARLSETSVLAYPGQMSLCSDVHISTNDRWCFSWFSHISIYVITDRYCVKQLRWVCSKACVNKGSPKRHRVHELSSCRSAGFGEDWRSMSWVLFVWYLVNITVLRHKKSLIMLHVVPSWQDSTDKQCWIQTSVWLQREQLFRPSNSDW